MHSETQYQEIRVFDNITNNYHEDIFELKNGLFAAFCALTIFVGAIMHCGVFCFYLFDESMTAFYVGGVTLTPFLLEGMDRLVHWKMGIPYYPNSRDE